MPTIAIGSSEPRPARRPRAAPVVGLARQLGAQVAGERGRGRVVEDQGGGQPQAGGGGQPVAQLDRGQRVEAEVA